MVNALVSGTHEIEEQGIAKQRERIAELKTKLEAIPDQDARTKHLLALSRSFN